MEETHAPLVLNFPYRIQMLWIQVQQYERPQLRQKSKNTDKKGNALNAQSRVTLPACALTKRLMHEP